MWVNVNEALAVDIYQLYALVLQIIKGRSIFYYNPSGLECSWQQNFTNQPQWVWHTQMPYTLLKERHNSELFVLACLPESFDVNALAGLSTSLNHLRSVPVLIELATGSPSLSSNLDSMLTQILTYCQQSSMLNVAIYFQRGTMPLTLYNFVAFPNFKLLKRRVTSLSVTGSGKLYPHQLDNLRGYAVRVIPDCSEPNTILYRNARGETRISGYMWHFIETFAEKLGAELTAVHPTWPLGRNLGELYMLEFTRNGSVDFGLIPVQVRDRFSKRYYQYSYPIVYGSWCITLPLERPIEVRAVFGHILTIKALVLLLIAFSCRYLLGAVPFPVCLRYCCRCLRLTPRLLALLVACACQAQLFSLMIHYPRQPPIDSFDALLASNLRIFGMRSEFQSLDDDFKARYAAAFRLTSNVSELFLRRNRFNTSWAYTITTIKWVIMASQQKYFQRPLFRFSELCLSPTYPYSILLSDESIYREALMLYTMRVYETGLLLHWMNHGFIDMLKADRMELKDYSTPYQVLHIRLMDFQFAWHCCGVGLLLALIVFAAELLRFYINVCLDSL